MDERDTAQYEREFVEIHEKDLKHTFLVVRSFTFYLHDLSNLVYCQAVLFSIVGAALAIGTRPDLKPNPHGQAAALLHALLLTLNHSAVPAETLAVPPVQEVPPSEVTNAILFFYECSAASALAASLAMVAKEGLNGFYAKAGALAIHSGADRQRKLKTIANSPFRLIVGIARILLRIATLFLVLGLCQPVWASNPRLIYPLALLAVPGLVGYYLTTANLATPVSR